MNAALFGASWVHLAGCVLVTGALFLLLLAGPPQSPDMRRWEQSALSATRWLVAVALVSGIVCQGARTAEFEGRPSAAFDMRAILHAMLDTWSGHISMLRGGFLILLAAVLLLVPSVSARRDWFAARAQEFLLAALALTFQATSSHAAAISDSAWPQIIDMLHLLAAGIWVGGLPFLALLLYCATRGDVAPDSYAVRAMQRFSLVALVAVLLLAVSGIAAAWLLVGGVAGLVGTAHGNLLLAKLAVLAPALMLAAANRRLLPSLSAPNERTSSATARRMALFIALEAVLVLALLGFAVAMTLTTPGVHGDPVWPWPFRLSFEGVPVAQYLQRLVQEPALAFALSGLGISLLTIMILKRHRKLVLMGTALILITGDAVLGLPRILVEAYPTSFTPPLITYHAGSIAAGMALYEAHCQSCHGALAALKGETAESAASLFAVRTTRRTAGELYWLITRGRAEIGMPAFETPLTDVDRWNLVNFLRTIEATVGPRHIRPKVDISNPWLAAPDFTIAVGPLTPKTLRDYRGRQMVLLVLYDLPNSGTRMSDLARHYGLLSVLGVEVIAVPSDHSPDAIAKLGASPPVLFPVVTDGADDITAAYRLFVPGVEHAEVLIDRQGYVRSIWRGVPDATAVQAQVEVLNQEKAPPPLPDDHVH